MEPQRGPRAGGHGGEIFLALDIQPLTVSEKAYLFHLIAPRGNENTIPNYHSIAVTMSSTEKDSIGLESKAMLNRLNSYQKPLFINHISVTDI